MFTGIITALGTIDEIITKADGDVRLGIMTPWDCTAIPLGASIACSGVCLTVVAVAGGRFDVDVSAETMAVTTLAAWQEGTQINLERALAMGDELGVISFRVMWTGSARWSRLIGMVMAIGWSLRRLKSWHR